VGLLVGNLPLLRIPLPYITAARRWQGLLLGFGLDHILDPLDQPVQTQRIMETWGFRMDKMLKAGWGDERVIETPSGMTQ